MSATRETWPDCVIRSSSPWLGLDGVEVVAYSNHAVPSAVRLEVAVDRIRGMSNRVRLLGRAQIGDHRRASIVIHSNDAVRDVRHTVRATGTGKYRVQRVAYERHVGNAAREPARLTRWQTVDPRFHVAVLVDARDARAILGASVVTRAMAAGRAIRAETCRRSHLRWVTRYGIAGLGDVQLVVWTELESTRVDQAGRKHGGDCRRVPVRHRRRICNEQGFGGTLRNGGSARI